MERLRAGIPNPRVCTGRRTCARRWHGAHRTCTVERVSDMKGDKDLQYGGRPLISSPQPRLRCGRWGTRSQNDPFSLSVRSQFFVVPFFLLVPPVLFCSPPLNCQQRGLELEGPEGLTGPPAGVQSGLPDPPDPPVQAQSQNRSVRVCTTQALAMCVSFGAATRHPIPSHISTCGSQSTRQYWRSCSRPRSTPYLRSATPRSRNLGLCPVIPPKPPVPLAPAACCRRGCYAAALRWVLCGCYAAGANPPPHSNINT